MENKSVIPLVRKLHYTVTEACHYTGMSRPYIDNNCKKVKVKGRKTKMILLKEILKLRGEDEKT